ncbi:MAG: ParB/RepB/Spo0J family partition protein [Firmicutes bacterium]|nr:ParB/RepB/Spo0J family partition protein [Bacillota bacterium]
MQKKGLGAKGRGMDALFGEHIKSISEMNEGERVTQIDIGIIEPNPEQPRKRFKESALTELAESIKEYGVIQPIIVRREADYYVLIAGERRFRASKIAGLKTIPAIVRDADEIRSLELAIVENVQREGLNPIEEAESYRRLNTEFHLSQEDISAKVGKSRVTITNALRLLKLEPRVRNFISEGKISGGHGRALLMIEDGELQFELAEHIIEEGLSVRDAEALVREKNEPAPEEPVRETRKKEAPYPKLEENLQNRLGTKVRITQGKKRGKIEIEYYSPEDLDRLFGLLGGNLN